MKNLFVILFSLFSLNSWAIEPAQYFRVWQGVQKAGVTDQDFLNELPRFMKETVDLYVGRALNNYIVVLPPKNRPTYIPDELALVALSSKEAYQKIRATPEGQRYSERPWDLFDKSQSQSLQHFINFRADHPTELNHNWAYDMIGEDIDWAVGTNFVYMGTRKSPQSPQQFLARLKYHVELTQATMYPKGLRGYIIIANDNYEVAYLNWASKAAHDQALRSRDGQLVFQDAREFMDTLMYEQAKAFQAGQPITNGAAYSTLQNEKDK